MKWSGNSWFLVVGLCLLVGCGTGQPITFPETANYNIIPKPKTLDSLNGFFHVNSTTTLNGSAHFKTFLEKHTGLKFNSDSSKHNNGIFISYESDQSGFESYSLAVTENRINLSAYNPTGVSRGLATLKQLIMLNSDSSGYFVPCVKITDAPAYQHRGLLLDCSRHFFDKEVVKKYIDLLALYKMNVLHWHLTEDQGWRIAIDKYPKLTEVGAWRTELDGSTYGGFYTKEEIKEIVTYAEERHITVIPEIELPGHSQAAIAAYPHLSCTGEQVEVANDWGVFKEIYCAGNDTVFTFLEDVLTEVMELFPSQFIHIGGDEAPKFRWEHCNKCKARMKSEGLKDAHELQSYFITRIEKFLNKNGRQLIGWDEILEGGLSPHSTVQSWRGMEGGFKAASLGHNVIMSPTSHCYLDYDLKAIDLEKVYNFNPMPEQVPPSDAIYIIGGEVNMWTEHVPDENNLDSKVFPRLLAMSEVLWSAPQEKNYGAFYNSVQFHYPILKSLGVNYGQETIPMTYKVQPAMESSYVTLIPSSDDVELKYRQACPTCDSSFTLYEGNKIHILHPLTLQVQPYKNEIKYGEIIEIPFENHRAINKMVKYNSKYSEWYTAGGDKGLVDSKIGSLEFRDGAWQGFWGNDLECIIDMDGVNKGFMSVSANFYQYNNSWIFIPNEMSASISHDGIDWEDWGTTESKVDPKQRGKFIHTLSIKHDEGERFRYLKIKVKNIGKVPDWHEAAGSDAWLFIDEIIVK